MKVTKYQIDDFLESYFKIPNLRGNEKLKIIFSKILEDLYTETPQKLLDFLDFKLNDQTIKLMYRNFGIDPSYYENLNYIIQKQLVFYLERLFQNKGNFKVFGILKELFSAFYNKMDFYNVSVSKLKTSSGKYRLAYTLKPLYVTEGKIKHFPDSPVFKSPKLLMKITDFERYNQFPIDTNLIYIDFKDSYSVSNNMTVFAQGCQAYANTRYQSKTITIYLQNIQKYEVINFTDIETILMWVNYRVIRMGPKDSEKRFDFRMNHHYYNSLIFEPEDLDPIEEILTLYKNTSTSDRKGIDKIKRQWQYLLRKYRTDTTKFNNFDELDEFIKDNYKFLYEEYKNLDVIDIYLEVINLFIETLQIVEAEDKYSDKYITSIFQGFISGPIFIQKFFIPLFDLFTNYFLPCTSDVIQSITDNIVTIRDKFNTVTYDNDIKTSMDTTWYSPHLHAISQRIITINISRENKVSEKDHIDTAVNHDQYDSNITNDRYHVARIKGSFIENILDITLNDYVWSIRRNAGITLEDKYYLLYDKYLTKNKGWTPDTTIENYLFYDN